MDCYKEFANIYDELINRDINYEQWAQAILKICDEENILKEDYLDLACGTGNLTSVIGSKFKNVWGVDLSEEMLIRADKKFRNIKFRAKLVCQNICELNLNKKFDLITCALDSTNYILDINDLMNYFKSVKQHLKDDGIFVFDINSYYKLSEVLGNNLFNYDDKDVVYIWENEFNDDIVDMYLTFFVRRDEVYERFDEEHSERAYRESELEHIICDNGLRVIKKLDNYEDKIINDKTERIVYVVKNEN